jgi:hypothetical protein
MSRRTLRHARPVTYTCHWGVHEYTELRYPSRLPRYCPACKPHARAAAAKQRRLQAQEHPRTRPADEWPRRRTGP